MITEVKKDDCFEIGSDQFLRNLKVEDYLPHRGNWLVTSFLVDVGQDYIVTVYEVPKKPSWAEEHFSKENAVMPGHLIAEVGAQALALHALLKMSEQERERSLPILIGSNWQYFGQVLPGDILVVRVDIDLIDPKNKRQRKGSVTIKVFDRVIASGEITGIVVPRRIIGHRR